MKRNFMGAEWTEAKLSETSRFGVFFFLFFFKAIAIAAISPDAIEKKKNEEVKNAYWAAKKKIYKIFKWKIVFVCDISFDANYKYMHNI